jgi:hypothetical protein
MSDVRCLGLTTLNSQQPEARHPTARPRVQTTNQTRNPKRRDSEILLLLLLLI